MDFADRLTVYLFENYPTEMENRDTGEDAIDVAIKILDRTKLAN